MTDVSRHLGVPAAPAAERERLAAVRRYRILDTSPDGTFDAIASLAARSLGAPVATVSTVDGDRIWFKAVHGLPGVSQIDRDPGLCATAIQHDTAYVVTDALTDPRTAANPLVHGEMGVRFYAAAPITTADGHRLGTVNVLDTRPREASEEQLAILGDLAALVGAMLGDEGLIAHLTSTPSEGADNLLANIHKLLTELGAGVGDDTALLALSVPDRHRPSGQEPSR